MRCWRDAAFEQNAALQLMRVAVSKMANRQLSAAWEQWQQQAEQNAAFRGIMSQWLNTATAVPPTFFSDRAMCSSIADYGDDCSIGSCPRNCSGPAQGVCVDFNCECASGFTGDDCSLRACPGSPPCFGNGACLDGARAAAAARIARAHGRRRLLLLTRRPSV